eukprot:m.83088 g.83088  ORF g.83088 m.83088 type:complete len:118 (+) comp14646_c0_seq2:149-502(+)
MSVVFVILAACAWGCTNPFIRRGAASNRDTTSQSFQVFRRWQTLLPIAINQTGSVFFALSLRTLPLSIASPATNSLTMLLTCLTGIVLRERPPSWTSLLGCSLIALGVVLCALSDMP